MKPFLSIETMTRVGTLVGATLVAGPLTYAAVVNNVRASQAHEGDRLDALARLRHLASYQMAAQPDALEVEIISSPSKKGPAVVRVKHKDEQRLYELHPRDGGKSSNGYGWTGAWRGL